MARYPSGRCRGAARFLPCAWCSAGAAVLAQLEAGGWTRPADSVPAIILEPAQQRARTAWVCSFPSYSEPEGGRLDPLAEVALAAPDDGGIVVDVG